MLREFYSSKWFFKNQPSKGKKKSFIKSVNDFKDDFSVRFRRHWLRELTSPPGHGPCCAQVWNAPSGHWRNAAHPWEPSCSLGSAGSPPWLHGPVRRSEHQVAQSCSCADLGANPISGEESPNFGHTAYLTFPRGPQFPYLWNGGSRLFLSHQVELSLHRKPADGAWCSVDALGSPLVPS